MRIAHVVPLISSQGAFGGPLRVALNQAAELRRRGHEVILCAGWHEPGRPPEEIEGIPLRAFRAYQLSAQSAFGTLISPRMWHWLFSAGRTFDVVHVHAGRDFLSTGGLLALKLRGVPFVTQSHGMVAADNRRLIKLLDFLLTRPLFRSAAARLALTPIERSTLMNSLKLASKQFTVLPNGLEPVEEVAWNPTEPPEVLFMSRLQTRKRPTVFVEMARLLIERGVEAKFVLVGPDEGCAELVEKLIQKLQLDDHVRYEGPLPYSAVAQRLAKAAVYVLPSIDEPFPMNLLEAMSLGVPCVTTSTCGIASVLQARSAASICDGSAVSLADCTQDLLDDFALAIRTSNLARKAVVEVFDIRRVSDQLEEIYSHVVPSSAK